MATSTDWQCGKSLSECLGYVLKENITTDVTFLLGKEKVPVHAHKLILISRSPVFHAMLDGPMAEKGDIEIPDITKETFLLLLQYMYTDQVALDVQSVMAVMAAARKYLVDRLIGECKMFVEKSINVTNVGIILEEAHTYREEDIMSKCHGFIQENTEEFFQCESFTSLCQECVYRIITSDELFVQEEQHVYEAALRWSIAECTRQNVEDTDENRRKVLGRILHEIRFPLIGDTFIMSEIFVGELLSGEEMKSVCRVKHKKRKSDIFKGIPRNGRTPKRFVRFNEFSKCNVYAEDGVTFSVSRRGYLTGICFIRPTANDKHLQFNKVEVLDVKGKCLSRIDDVSISVSDSDQLADIMLEEKILLEKETRYSICVSDRSCFVNLMGCNGKEVAENGSTTVHFFKHRESIYGTIKDGIIVGILFS